MTILESGVDTRELFRIEISGGRYFAVRDSAPRFVLSGSSAVEVAKLAAKALKLAGASR